MFFNLMLKYISSQPLIIPCCLWKMRTEQIRITKKKESHFQHCAQNAINSPVLYCFGCGRSSQFGHKNSYDVEEKNKVYLEEDTQK